MAAMIGYSPISCPLNSTHRRIVYCSLHLCPCQEVQETSSSLPTHRFDLLASMTVRYELGYHHVWMYVLRWEKSHCGSILSARSFDALHTWNLALSAMIRLSWITVDLWMLTSGNSFMQHHYVHLELDILRFQTNVLTYKILIKPRVSWLIDRWNQSQSSAVAANPSIHSIDLERLLSNGVQKAVKALWMFFVHCWTTIAPKRWIESIYTWCTKIMLSASTTASSDKWHF